jgi:hypothetical protein
VDRGGPPAPIAVESGVEIRQAAIPKPRHPVGRPLGLVRFIEKKGHSMRKSGPTGRYLIRRLLLDKKRLIA